MEIYKKYIHNLLAQKSEEKLVFGRHRRRWNDVIKTDLKEREDVRMWTGLI
jgi:hypothetical protein